MFLWAVAHMFNPLMGRIPNRLWVMKKVRFSFGKPEATGLQKMDYKDSVGWGFFFFFSLRKNKAKIYFFCK